MSDPALTDYGFRWGPVEVERMASFDRKKDGKPFRVIGLYINDGDNRKRRLEIYVSPTGRSVRVWRDGAELVEAPD